MSSSPTRNRKFKKKIAKKFKKLENTIIASFQGKIGWERPRNRENKKKKSFPCVPTRPVIENSKKKSKKIQKTKETIMASFKAKISWEGTRKRKEKNRSNEFLRDP